MGIVMTRMDPGVSYLPEDARAVLVFGSSGVGKSSLINALAGTSFTVGSSAKGVTFDRQIAEAVHDGRTYHFVDTVGLDEAKGGQVEAEEALKKAKKLVEELSGKLRLLVMVVRKGRILEKDKKNYDVFYKAITGTKVRMIIAVTWCEGTGDMTAWVRENKQHFRKLGMNCRELVPVTFMSIEPENSLVKEDVLKKEREESSDRLWTAIHNNAMPDPVNFVAVMGGIASILKSIARIIFPESTLASGIIDIIDALLESP